MAASERRPGNATSSPPVRQVQRVRCVVRGNLFDDDGDLEWSTCLPLFLEGAPLDSHLLLAIIGSYNKKNIPFHVVFFASVYWQFPTIMTSFQSQ